VLLLLLGRCLLLGQHLLSLSQAVNQEGGAQEVYDLCQPDASHDSVHQRI
jgi:hypothetical protein